METMRNLPIKKRLVGIRAMVGLTQKEMAKHLGVSRATYNRKENNPEAFSAKEKEKIQNLFKNYIIDCPEIF